LANCDTVRQNFPGARRSGASHPLYTFSKANLLTFDTVLTNLGEKMSDEEVDELLKIVDTSSGEINYTGILSTTAYNL